ncbi:calcium-binding protein [Nostoc favosum]|uniref:Calcium-binding protein n=1 Tax=Nostoc favosum CHAB5714 TaxID=2780399 RepID=A0ABS8I962_9NOSO|nr:calcium-binding protein [Nostoc favosum]MCC5600239.1 calcium-binding protein [Nostoc favosum CHAB5714]
MANIIGTKGNDTLVGSELADTIKGLAGNDTITPNQGDDTLTGGGGKDQFVYSYYYESDTDTITDFGGVGKGTNPTVAVIAEVDTLKFEGNDLFSARNLLLTQNGSNLEITFEDVFNRKIILQNFKLENLENQKATGATPAIGNILFNGQTSITDSFDVFDANSTDTKLGIKNTVTFLNDLSNNITGKDDSDDVVNGQGGNDKIYGLSGNDLLRGGTGNDTLIGGVGKDTLIGSTGNNSLVGGTNDDVLNAEFSTGDNTLNGGAGNDTLNAGATSGNNLLSGGDGNDSFSLGSSSTAPSDLLTQTVDGGTGDDFLQAYYTNATGRMTSTFNATTNIGSITAGTNRVNYKNIERLEIRGTTYDDLIVGTNGNDDLFGGSSGNDPSYGNDTIFGGKGNDYLFVGNSTSNNILNADVGEDQLNADYSTGNNLLSGGDGNDLLSVSDAKGNNTLKGGAGDDELNANSSTGDNLLDGEDGNDSLYASVDYTRDKLASGNNTLKGGAGDDKLNANSSTGDNLLDGGDGDDSLNAAVDYSPNRRRGGTALGSNTLKGGAGDDQLIANFSTGDNLLDGGDGNDSLNASIDYSDNKGYGAFDNNILNGGDGNDDFYLVTYNNSPSNLVTQIVDGGTGDDLLTVLYIYPRGGITSTFDAATNIGSITKGTNRVNYKNIERLNISGTEYNDLIVGSNGNDTLSGSISGNDTIDGGTGEDLLSVYYDRSSVGITSTFDAATNIGSITAGTNRVSYKNIERLEIRGTEYDDLIVGSNGNDTIDGSGSGGSSGGNDTIDGGAGDDILSADYGNKGNKLISGGDGNDTLSSGGSGGNDTIDGGADDDLLIVRYYSNSTGGGGITSAFNAATNIGSITAGTNLVSYKNIEQLNIGGTEYDDLIVGSSGNDTLSTGAAGNDTINGGLGEDYLSVDFRYSATAGITSTFNATTNIGSITTGTNQVSYNNIEQLNFGGTEYDDLIVGSNGNDTIDWGNGGSDTIDGGLGDDLLSFYNYTTSEGITSTFDATTNIGSITVGTNRVSYKNIERLDVRGTIYDDLIVGSNGNDTLFGSFQDRDGNDTIIGGAGNDILTGGRGNDSLIGGAGTDTFVFSDYSEGIGTIYDFNAANELIQVSAAGFGGGLSTPSLQASQFTIGTSATTTTQRFIYNSATGGLFFDLDGSASGFTQVQLAQLSGGVTLTENNFVIV